MDERLARMEERLNMIQERLARIERVLYGNNPEHGILTRIERLSSDLKNQWRTFKWFAGVSISLLATILSLLVKLLMGG